MQFKEVINQEETKKGLIRFVSEQRISHALMFVGPPGSGKLALAIAFAQYIACDSRAGGDSCGKCPSCVKYNKLVHPDLHFLFPVMTTAKVTNPISDSFMNEWRDLVTVNPYISENEWYEAIGAENKQGFISKNESNEIIRKLGLKSYESEYKIVIIWLPEKMNHYAANALLKLIEEPPPKTLFLMVSENTEHILPTILSRTQLIRVPALCSKHIRDALLKKEADNFELVEDAIKKANGNYNVALNVLRNIEQELQYLNLFQTFMRHCYKRKLLELSEMTEQIASMGRERQKQLLSYFLRMVRENFMLNIDREELTYLSRQENEFSKRFSSYIHRGNVFDLADQISLAFQHIEANGNPKIIFMDLAIQVILLLKQESETD
ncbi:MAG: DNA polymerase III subunit delta [Bacteroidales bacterium]|nr:DNA polymerase III subunit delta [Bacteroidales bacterium]MBN2698777.1 DNA polymerase III subunit delta [Bacteroidales bacterium]